MYRSLFNKRIENPFIISLTIFLSIVFLWMIRSFIIPLVLSAITAGLTSKLYRWISLKIKNPMVAAFITVILVLLIFVIPLAILTTIVVDQATTISKNIVPFIENEVANNGFDELQIPDWIPFHDQIDLTRENVVSRFRDFSGKIGNVFVTGLANVTQGTFILMLDVFIFLYALFFFLLNGTDYLNELKEFIPMKKDDFQQLLDQFTSVTRATLKGAILIGVLQGALVGLAFYYLGLGGAAFWGTVSAVASIIPSVGSGLIWFPAVVWLFIQGNVAGALGLLAWGAGVVGTIDNILRPRLVGDDTKMSDLIILLSTLGGISLFGFVGFIIGPLIAGLVLTTWKIYKKKFIETEEESLEDITLEINQNPTAED